MNRFSDAVVKLPVRVTSRKHFNCLISNESNTLLHFNDNKVYHTFHFSALNLFYQIGEA